MKTYEQRLKNVSGQINGISKMIENEEDAFKVLTQMKAARSALNSAMSVYIQDNFWDFINQCSDKEDSCRKFFDEVIQTN